MFVVRAGLADKTRERLILLYRKLRLRSVPKVSTTAWISAALNSHSEDLSGSQSAGILPASGTLMLCIAKGNGLHTQNWDAPQMFIHLFAK